MRLEKPRANCELEESAVLRQHSRHVAEELHCVSQKEIRKASRSPCEMGRTAKGALLYTSFWESNLCLVPWTSGPSSNLRKIFTPSVWEFTRIHPKPVSLPPCIFIFYFEQETEGAPRWFLLMTGSLAASRGGP